MIHVQSVFNIRFMKREIQHTQSLLIWSEDTIMGCLVAELGHVYSTVQKSLSQKFFEGLETQNSILETLKLSLETRFSILESIVRVSRIKFQVETVNLHMTCTVGSDN